MTSPPTTAGGFVPAELDRRFYAFVLDRLLGYGLIAVIGYLAWRTLLEEGRTTAGVAVVASAVLLVSLLSAVLLGLLGVTPGKAVTGLRVVDLDGRPIGVRLAMLRVLLLGVLTLPTGGLGLATLAWTAVTSPDGLRRGVHDQLTRAVVVDVRPVPPAPDPTDASTRPIVNLTTLRLMPTPTTTPPPSSPPPSSPPLVRPAVGWRVSFDTGEAFVVEGLALVGRRPEPRSDEPVRHVVPLPSSDLSLSKTHAQFQVVPDGALVVMDRGSTNGSVLVRQGVSRPLGAGRPATLLDGDTVRFGDRAMTVTREPT